LIGFLLLLTTGCDQLTKNIAKTKLISSAPISLLNDLIRLEYAENPGAFLSIGEHLPSPILLLLSSVLVSAVILLLVKLSIQKRNAKLATLVGLSLLAGGSLGNLIDRVLHNGVVVDFMSVGIGRMRSGIFNLADVAILIGVFVLMLVTGKKPDKIDFATRRS
jgi:signal peptidase II